MKCVAIGNGTGSREINRLVTTVIKENELKDVKRLVVSEAGAVFILQWTSPGKNSQT